MEFSCLLQALLLSPPESFLEVVILLSKLLVDLSRLPGVLRDIPEVIPPRTWASQLGESGELCIGQRGVHNGFIRVPLSQTNTNKTVGHDIKKP